ncbi:hypothetical protein DFH07DRAFT_404910 [Mycena maculata]|uniref:Uncharacterized protein n=1 Tax=Mycena maculata TaxID=230809 RepID=A0AAD7NJC5_9AGAR|nr:hypothetical protein DFH07DRAFT_404910 [Mycena maculata]
MSFTNINDPAGVKALLDSLRASQAWQNLVNTPGPEPTPASLSTPIPNPPLSGTETETNPGPSTSVAALLSQLNSAPTTRPAEDSRKHAPTPDPSPNRSLNLKPSQTPSQDPPPSVPEDARGLTFQQALPRLAQLADDPVLVATLGKLKQEQDKLEHALWAERGAIRTKYEEKVKVAKTRATLIGTGMSKHEAEMLSQAYEKELKRFDAERVLPAWDGLVTSQQAALAQLRVPTMFPTAVKHDREKQQRVMQVLEGIVGSAET